MTNNINPHKVGTEICKITGVDIFKNTKTRKYVELRALVCYTLREELYFTMEEIAKYFNSKGKKMHHASVIHLLKMYPIYKEHNKNLEKLEGSFNFESSIVKNEIFGTNEKYQNLEYQYEKLKKGLKNPIINLIHDLPEERWSEVIERIDLLKQSWSWKSQDRCEIIESSDGLSNRAF
jgi:hypothetical protein